VTDSPNVELVRSIYADWERGDFATAEWADPEIEYVIADGPQPGTWRGRTEMAEGFRDFLSGLEEYRLEAQEYREVDDQCVLVLVHASGHGKTSGLELEQVGSKPGAAAFCVRDSRVVKLAFYWDRANALADLGLAPEGNATD
jgi:ketosteroid isomerase-like protein